MKERFAKVTGEMESLLRDSEAENVQLRAALEAERSAKAALAAMLVAQETQLESQDERISALEEKVRSSETARLIERDEKVKAQTRLAEKAAPAFEQDDRAVLAAIGSLRIDLQKQIDSLRAAESNEPLLIVMPELEVQHGSDGRITALVPKAAH